MGAWTPIARRARLVTSLLCAGLLAVAGTLWQVTQASATGRAQHASSAAPQVHVSGNKLVNAGGQQVVLHGVDRSGGEYACVRGTGIWDGPMDQSSITAMQSWHVNAVRVPLNEACWNGESYILPQYRGVPYRQAVEAYVRLLNLNGMVAILDLHRTDGAYTGPSSACSSAQALCQKPMPDAAQSIPFWTSVAQAFSGNNAVIFDLFNEPYPEEATGGSESEGWQCWLRGGSACAGISYKVAGMQSLVTAVRSVGAKNVIMLGGLNWANDLTGWLANEPADPDHNLAASWHSYMHNSCNSVPCWNSQVAPVIAKVPVIAGEIGETDCADTYMRPLMTWLDAQSTGYLAWAWDANSPCSGGPSLITSYAGAPTAYGAGYLSHLQSLAAARQPTALLAGARPLGRRGRCWSVAAGGQPVAVAACRARPSPHYGQLR
jgi:endoglucanase